MNLPCPSITLFLLWLCAAPVFAAPSNTLTVGPPGSGSDFSTIQDAIDFASDGDIVLVDSGFYAPFVIDGKDVDVLGVPGNQTYIDTEFATSLSIPGVKIMNLPTTADVRLVGLRITSLQLAAGQVEHLIIQNCDGKVLVADIVAGFPQHYSPPGPGVESWIWIENCARIVVNELAVGNQGPGTITAAGFQGMNGVSIINSFVAGDLYARGETGAIISGSGGSFPGSGIIAIESELDISGYENGIIGGSGGGWGTIGNIGFSDGAPAIKLINSDLVLRGGQVTGGDNSSVGSATWAGALAGPGVYVDWQSSSTCAGQQLDLRGGMHKPSGQRTGAVEIETGGTHVQLPFILPFLNGYSTAQIGSSVNITGTGNVFIYFSMGQEFTPQSIPGVYGERLISAPYFLILSPGTGYSAQVDIPNNPLLIGQTAYFQSYQPNPPIVSQLKTLTILE